MVLMDPLGTAWRPIQGAPAADTQYKSFIDAWAIIQSSQHGQHEYS